MPGYLCHRDPDALVFETEVVDVRPGAVRLAQSWLHPGSHILNAFVFRRFEGALVTGAQINGDGTGRMDFDLPGFDNDKLRGLDEEINAAIRAALPVETRF